MPDVEADNIRCKRLVVEESIQVGFGEYRIDLLAHDGYAMIFVYGAMGGCGEFVSLQACRGQAGGAPILVVGSKNGDGHDFCVGGTNENGEMLFQLGIPNQPDGKEGEYLHVSMGELHEAIKAYRASKPATEPVVPLMVQMPPKQD